MSLNTRDQAGRSRVLAVASSTGGAQVIADLLKALPHDAMGPVLIAHHLEPTFVSTFSRWLHEASGWPVVVVTSRHPLIDGTAFLATGGKDLVVDAGGVFVDDASSPSIPCADRLFAAAAEAFGPRLTGLVVSGMGDDGARGLKAIVDNRGRAFCQPPSTALVKSMPEAALAAVPQVTVLSAASLPQLLAG